MPHHMMLVRRASLNYLNYTNSFKLGSLPEQVSEDEIKIGSYFSKRDKDLVPRFSVNQENNH